MSSSNSSRLWNDGLKLVSYCPLCETRYNPMQAKILGEDGETHLLHVTCRKCRNSILAVVLTNPSGVSSVGLITDLSFEDVHKFQSAPGVTVDDVIDIHTFVEGNSWKQLYAPARMAKRHTMKKKVSRAPSEKSK